MNRWRVVAGGVSMNLALGSLYAWSVFVLPLEKEFGWDTAEISSAMALRFVLFGLMAPFAAVFLNRLGVRRMAIIALGTIIFGLPGRRIAAASWSWLARLVTRLMVRFWCSVCRRGPSSKTSRGRRGKAFIALPENVSVADHPTVAQMWSQYFDQLRADRRATRAQTPKSAASPTSHAVSRPTWAHGRTS